MDEYISDKQYRELSKQIHFDIEINKRDESKLADLKIKLEALKKLRKKSMLLEIEDAKKNKGL